MFLSTKHLKFKIALTTVFIYEIAMLEFKLDGLSLFKILLTILVWISCGIAIFEFIKGNEKLKRRVPKAGYIILIILFGWNLISILRSILSGGSLSTIFGNVYTALALLVPIVIIFCIHKINLKALLDYFVFLLTFGIIAFSLLLLASAGNFNDTQLLILILLLQPTIFLIPLIPFLRTKKRILILLSAVLLFYVSFKYGNRTMMIKEILLLLALLAIYIYQKFKIKMVLLVSFTALLVPFLLLKQSIDTGVSAIQTYLSKSDSGELSIDTRTFLYIELYEDLVQNNKVVQGKGAFSTYYSGYFNSISDGDAANRLDIEVGILSILLKGGMIAVILNLTLLVLSIFYAFFRTNNLFVVGIGYMLMLHVFFLFLDNRIGYTTDNFIIWFFVGLSLSKEIRGLKNSEIISILSQKN